mgnify:CR=1 FL=1
MDQHISEVKNTTIELMENLVGRIDSICSADDTEKFARMIYFMDDLMALSEGLDVIKSYYKGIDLVELLEKFDMLKKAMEESDIFLIDDIMKYELKDLLVYWIGILLDKQ